MNPFAIVTGTSRGIGRAAATALLERGWDVLGLARGVSPFEHERYVHERVDLAETSALEACFEGVFGERFATRRRTRVGLVNNAGVLEPVGPVTGLSATAIAASLAVNFVAPTWLAGAVLRSTDSSAAVRIVNVSSGAATKAYAGWTAYCSGKAALQMAGEVLATELESYDSLIGRDVAVVSYAPHVVATRMQEQLRSLGESEFPLRQRFVDLERNGELVNAEGPASEIADLLERDGLPLHTTARFEPPQPA